MSTSAGTRSTSTRPLNVRERLRQRGVDATHRLNDTLRLSASTSDAKLLGTAVAEIVAEESARNPQLAARIRARYDELINLRGTQKPGPGKKTEQLPPLVPIRRDLPYRAIDPTAPPDPHWLTLAYGHNQLARALQDFTVDMLKQTANNVQREHAGAKPASRSSRAALIEYIVSHTSEQP